MDNEKELKLHYEVVCAVIVKDDKIFCCQRGPKGECAFNWEFPGGKIEPGETKEEALLREIKEELNCNINIEKFITTINHEYNTFSLTMHVYLCSLKESVPILLEHKSSIWCDKDKLNELDFAEADYKSFPGLMDLAFYYMGSKGYCENNSCDRKKCLFGKICKRQGL